LLLLGFKKESKMGFFTPKWKHYDSLVRAEAVEKMNPEKNQEILANLAQIDPSFFVRYGAVEKLDKKKHQELCAQIAVKDASDEVRGAAIKKLNPKNYQELMAKRIQIEESIEIKKYIVKKLDPKKWEGLIRRIKSEISDKVCQSCEVLLIKSKSEVPKIVPIVGEGFTVGWKTENIAKKEAIRVKNSFAYSCKSCGTLICKKCSTRKKCPKCGKKTFVSLF
jgi:predicted RNA-binding Zn-ribbon protein involved in translation (DUF1610 family)